MRIFAVALLTISQFTAFPFLAILAANTARHGAEARVMQQADLHNVTVVYKSVTM